MYIPPTPAHLFQAWAQRVSATSSLISGGALGSLSLTFKDFLSASMTSHRIDTASKSSLQSFKP